MSRNSTKTLADEHRISHSVRSRPERGPSGGQPLLPARPADLTPRAAHRRCRGQKTPLKESRFGLRSRIGCPTPVGAALAATGPLLSAGVDSGRRRGQKTPPTEPRPSSARGSGAPPPWERPWPRQGRCWPLASIQAAVRVRRPLPQNPGSGSGRGSGAPPLWERPWPRQGRCWPLASIRLAVGVRRPLPQNPGSGSGRGSGAPPLWERSSDRDRAVAVRWRRFRPQSGSEDPSHRALARAPLAGRARHPCGSGLGRDAAFERRWRPLRSASGCAFSTRSRPPAGRTPALRRHALRSATPRRRRAA